MKKLYRTFAVSAALLAGATSAFAGKTINVLIPSDNESWESQTPMISMDGGVTGKAMTEIPNRCGWFTYTFEGEVSDNVVFYPSNDANRDNVIGLKGNWESSSAVTAIPLASLFKAYDKETLYFVSDEDQLLDGTEEIGWYTFDPFVDGNCSDENKVAITVNKHRDVSENTTAYDICYSTFDETACGKDIEELVGSKIEYYLISNADWNTEKTTHLTSGKESVPGIDLTNPYEPKVNKKRLSIQPGRWTLLVSINGRTKKMETFRSTGGVNILATAEADVLDSNGNQLKGLHYTATTEIVAGVPTPIYISTILDDTENHAYLSIDDAVGITYFADADNPRVHLYEKIGEDEYLCVDGSSRIIGNDGVDTLYVFLDPKDLNASSSEATILLNGINELTVNFKAGQVLQKAVMGIGSMAKSAPSSKSYAIYNMQGQLIKKGMLTDGAQLTVPTSGTYMVRMGNTSKVMKFK